MNENHIKTYEEFMQTRTAPIIAILIADKDAIAPDDKAKLANIGVLVVEKGAGRQAELVLLPQPRYQYLNTIEGPYNAVNRN